MTFVHECRHPKFYNTRNGSTSTISTRRAIESCSSTELAWLAGFIDGEGCMSLVKSKDYLSVYLKIVNTHLPTMERVAELTGGEVKFYRTEGNRKAAYGIHFGAHRAVIIIEAIQSYLITKFEHSEIILKFFSTVGGKVSEEDLVQRKLLAEKLRRLNARGAPTQKEFLR